ncbi:MAG: hypothetical protein JXA14_04720 [Anaerolineae bacterium]|nr:hypothetical protein [Anaerolineae bacterium]
MNRKVVATTLILALATLACGQASEVMSDVAGTLEAATVEVPEMAEATAEPVATIKPPQGDNISQWAISAVASSEYGASDWSAMQATGAPNTPECGDQVTAWASATAGTEEWIELTYATFVHPMQVNIFQTYYPNQVVKVELIDSVSGYHVIYTGAPEQLDTCPYVLSIPVKNADYIVAGIRITIDQSVVQDWNEIDAVELVGVPAEE